MYTSWFILINFLIWLLLAASQKIRRSISACLSSKWQSVISFRRPQGKSERSHHYNFVAALLRSKLNYSGKYIQRFVQFIFAISCSSSRNKRARKGKMTAGLAIEGRKKNSTCVRGARLLLASARPLTWRTWRGTLRHVSPPCACVSSRVCVRVCFVLDTTS